MCSFSAYKTSLVYYLENFPFVEVQNLLLEPTVAHRLEAHQSQHLDELMLLGNTVLNVIVDLEMKYKQTN